MGCPSQAQDWWSIKATHISPAAPRLADATTTHRVQTCKSGTHAHTCTHVHQTTETDTDVNSPSSPRTHARTCAQIFGLTPDVADNVCYIDEQVIAFPAGKTDID
jgi:hypothetical protein